MPQQTDFQKRGEAIRLREEERLPLKVIAARVGYSNATVCRWLKDHPLTPEESKKIRWDAARPYSTGRKQSPETIRKRVEKSREKIRASAIARFGGAWALAKDNGQIKYVSHKPCGCGANERYVKSKTCVECEFKKHRDPSRRYMRLFLGAQYRSRTFGLPFDLTIEYVKQIWPSDNLCPVLGIILESPHKGRGKITPNSPTLDRIRPSAGYVQGNVAVLSYKANTMKQDCIEPDVFRRIANWLEIQLRQ
jgi:Homeodomain-like domain